MTVEKVIPIEDSNVNRPTDDEIIDKIMNQICPKGDISIKGFNNLRFFRRNKKYFDLMISKYHLIFERTLNDICLTEFGDVVCKAGGWLKYLESQKNEETERQQKINDYETLERELKESSIKVNKLTLEMADQNRRITDLTENNLRLQNENYEYKNTIREQEQRIRNLEEKTLFISLLQKYWWVILTSIGIGITLRALWDKMMP